MCWIKAFVIKVNFLLAETGLKFFCPFTLCNILKILMQGMRGIPLDLKGRDLRYREFLHIPRLYNLAVPSLLFGVLPLSR